MRFLPRNITKSDIEEPCSLNELNPQDFFIFNGVENSAICMVLQEVTGSLYAGKVRMWNFDHQSENAIDSDTLVIMLRLNQKVEFITSHPDV